MDIIRDQRITSVDSMTTEDSSFPKENCIDLRPGNVSKSTGQSCTIGMTGSGTAFGLFNVSAVTGTITVVDNSLADSTSGVNLSTTNPSTITRASGSFLTDGFSNGDSIFLKGFTNTENNGFFTVNVAGTLTMTVTATSLVTEGAAAGREVISMENPKIDAQALKFVTYKTWTEYFTASENANVNTLVDIDDEVFDATIKLVLTGSAVYDPVSIGLIVMGYKINYGRTQYGFGNGFRDFSIKTNTASGALAKTERPVVRTPQATVNCTTAQSHMLQQFIKDQGDFGNVLIFKEIDLYQEDLIIFGDITSPPVPRWSRPTTIQYNINAREII